MAKLSAAALEKAVEALPRAFPGPGGAVAVVRDGEAVIRHAWGFANAERRIAFTPRTLFRMCSVTKQFTCAALIEAFPDPSALDAEVAARLPLLEGARPATVHLAHNQSGLRDYWAVAMLHGAPAESAFGEVEARAVMAGARSLQFAPGERFSYCNQNFRLISNILEDRSGEAFADILRRRIFARAGMESAFLAADTRAMSDGAEGYEGSQERGFRAAENRILWTGDAGLGASLDDMIAWERFIDATRDADDGLYRRLSAPVRFADGAPASYGFGLSRGRAFGAEVTGHGGALRGWRSHRVHVAAERLSVVVLFNHLSDAHAAAMEVLAAALGAERPAQPADRPAPAWLGAYTDPQTGLAARIEPAGEGRVRVRYGHSPEVVEVNADGSAGTDGTRIAGKDGEVVMDRPGDNVSINLQPLGAATGARDVAGRYRCAELDAELTVAEAGGVLYGGFSGFLGQGRMEQLDPVGADIFALPCARALDHTPPGDWTVAFHRQGAGPPDRLTLGCWLARGLCYERVG